MQSRQKKTQPIRSSLAKAGALLLSLAGFANADQPVHCIKDNVVGEWHFEVMRRAELPNIFEAHTVCTHELPNKLQIIEDGHQFELDQGDEGTYDLYITLHPEGHTCHAHSSVAEYSQCNWTLMYDQALIIWLDEETLMANFRYEVKSNTRKAWENLQTGDYDEFNFKCGQTMVGVVRNIIHKDFSCMVGRRTTPEIRSNVHDDRNTCSMAQTSSQMWNPHGMSMMFAQTSSSQTQPTQLAQTSSGTMRTLHDVPEQDRIMFAQKINENKDLSWQANSYSQIEMEKLDNNRAMSFAQTSAFGQRADFQDVLSRAQMYLRDGPEGIDFDDLPDEFDWSDFEGHDFVGQPKDQKSCGSCYMIATITMLESRIKIWYGEEKSLSSQMPLQCNFLTEGCHGGWGLLAGMFLESYYTVEDRSAPYKAATQEHTCSMYKDAPAAASVESTYYIGGAYGAMTEESLMKEIRARGPVLYDFNAGYEFMTYQSGVLAEEMPHGCSGCDLNDPYINLTSQEELGIQYQKLTHSTLLIGWGIDERTGMRYWKVRNSYGPNWGERGCFNVRRGHNDFGGEGENAAVIPICHTCSRDRADL